MKQPLVSVMMPTYNQEAFVAEALTSAIEQDYANLQIVVSDDGSVDDTVNIVREYEKKYPGRIVAFTNGPHLGITGNCNRALRACQGKYITFHAGDDIYLPGKISKQVEWMESDERRVLCTHDVEVFDSATGRRLYLKSDKSRLRSGIGPKSIIKGLPFGAISVMVRSSALPSYGYDERLSYVSDWKLWIDCLSKNGYYGYIEGVYSKYRRHADNITTYADRYHRERIFADWLTMLALVETHYPQFLSECRKARANIFYVLAIYTLLEGNRNNAYRYFANAIVHDIAVPWKAYVGFFVSLLPKYVFDLLLPRIRALKSAQQFPIKT